VPGYTNSYAYGINDAGVIVGDLHAPGNLGRPFVYSRGVMTNLNDLIPPGSGLTLLSARGINNAGQIVGWGRYIGSTPDHAVLLTPGGDTAPAVDVGILTRPDALAQGFVMAMPLDRPPHAQDRPVLVGLFPEAPANQTTLSGAPQASACWGLVSRPGPNKYDAPFNVVWFSALSNPMSAPWLDS
jgi:hypothetical protein